MVKKVVAVRAESVIDRIMLGVVYCNREKYCVGCFTKILKSMKKVLFILILIYSSLFAKGQSNPFLLTPTGFKNTADTSKEFIVLEFPGKSKLDLYKSVELFVNKKYMSPKDVISKVDNEAISVNGFSARSIRRNTVHIFDMTYTLNFEFKDDKLKVSAPVIILTTGVLKQQKLYLVADMGFGSDALGIWNRALKLKSAKAKEDLEEFFNKYISTLKESIIEKKDW